MSNQQLNDPTRNWYITAENISTSTTGSNLTLDASANINLFSGTGPTGSIYFNNNAWFDSSANLNFSFGEGTYENALQTSSTPTSPLTLTSSDLFKTFSFDSSSNLIIRLPNPSTCKIGSWININNFSSTSSITIQDSTGALVYTIVYPCTPGTIGGNGIKMLAVSSLAQTGSSGFANNWICSQSGGGPTGRTGSTGPKGDTGFSYWSPTGPTGIYYMGPVYIPNGILEVKQGTTGGLVNSILKLENNSGFIGTGPTGTGIVSFETFRSGNTIRQGDYIYSQSAYAISNVTSAKTEYSRITTQVTNTSGGGGDDGAVGIWCAVNGVTQQVMLFNGADNENNSFRPLDMNGNVLKSSIGPGLILDASTNSVPLIMQTANTGPTGSGSGLQLTGKSIFGITGTAGTTGLTGIAPFIYSGNFLALTINGVAYKLPLYT